MKAKVLTRFFDKVTKEIHEPDDVIEITPERFNELLKKGRYIEVYVEKKEEKPKQA